MNGQGTELGFREQWAGCLVCRPTHGVRYRFQGVGSESNRRQGITATEYKAEGWSQATHDDTVNDTLSAMGMKLQVYS